MKTQNLIILAVTILLIALLAYIVFGTQTTPENNTTNETINLTLNETNNTTENQTTPKTTTKKQTKTKEPKVISDELQYNYQVDDGSYYRQVEYSDGNFRQIDTNGKIIGSSYKNDHVEGQSMA